MWQCAAAADAAAAAAAAAAAVRARAHAPLAIKPMGLGVVVRQISLMRSCLHGRRGEGAAEGGAVAQRATRGQARLAALSPPASVHAAATHALLLADVGANDEREAAQSCGGQRGLGHGQHGHGRVRIELGELRRAGGVTRRACRRVRGRQPKIRAQVCHARRTAVAQRHGARAGQRQSLGRLHAASVAEGLRRRSSQSDRRTCHRAPHTATRTRTHLNAYAAAADNEHIQRRQRLHALGAEDLRARAGEEEEGGSPWRSLECSRTR